MHIVEDTKLDFSDVLIRPKTSSLTSRSEVDVTREFRLPHAGWVWHGVPIIAANMDTTGTVEMASTLGNYNALTALHKFYQMDYLLRSFEEDKLLKYKAFYSMGVGEHEINALKVFINKAKNAFLLQDMPRMICIDVANGYSMQLVTAINEVRELCPNAFIMAGNVVTGEKAEEIINAGADCVKLGIGPGSVCTTRKMTGVGYPQLSAILETADAAHGLKGLVCADGGCTVPGDIVKAFGAGADFVMLGGMLAGTDESSGELVEDLVDFHTVRYKRFYGMSSKTANENYNGGLKDYRAAEGKEVLIPYKGSASEVMDEILGGLRSGMTYVGAEKLKELTKRTTFVRVNRQLNNVYGS